MEKVRGAMKKIASVAVLVFVVGIAATAHADDWYVGGSYFGGNTAVSFGVGRGLVSSPCFGGGLSRYEYEMLKNHGTAIRRSSTTYRRLVSGSYGYRPVVTSYRPVPVVYSAPPQPVVYVVDEAPPTNVIRRQPAPPVYAPRRTISFRVSYTR